jgi:hypothetical protein
MEGERVTGIVTGAKLKTGLLSSKTYTLVFTDRRLILAETTKAVASANVEAARSASKAEGKGWMGQWGAQMKAAFAFGAQYFEMDPDAIVAETPGNPVVTQADVARFKVDRKMRSNGDDDQPYLRITIEGPAGKREFKTGSDEPSEQAVRAMAAGVFGAAVR